MTRMTANDSTSASPRESFYLSEPVSVVGVCVDEEMWRFLGVFAGSTGLIQLRARVGDYRSGQDQDAVLECLGNPAPDICLVDFDKDRRSAAMVAERIHSGLPDTAVFAVSSQTHPGAILEAMRSGCGGYLGKALDSQQLVKARAPIGAPRKKKTEQWRAQMFA